ncbi:hypothetical protein NQZ68_034760 [Dissostichus eleginoides]|nr:hypothetical protein NQZ68_034760 [Dissostichus eleginoides]
MKLQELRIFAVHTNCDTGASLSRQPERITARCYHAQRREMLSHSKTLERERARKAVVQTQRTDYPCKKPVECLLQITIANPLNLCTKSPSSRLLRTSLTLAAADEHPEEMDELKHHGFGLQEICFQLL